MPASQIQNWFPQHEIRTQGSDLETLIVIGYQWIIRGPLESFFKILKKQNN